MSDFSLAGQVALVTGAGRGLGRALALGLARAGAHVLVNGRTERNVEAAAAAIRAAGGRADALVADVSDTAQIDRAFARIEAEHGRLDILVNNVGNRDRRGVFEFALSDVRQLIETNLVAPFELSRRAARMMMARGRGRIINVTSIAGELAAPGDAAYIASKGAMAALTRAMAAEFGPSGITVNAIAPGFFVTEANAHFAEDPATLEHLDRRTALRRWGRPEEVSGAAIFLASDAAGYVTGHVLVVDGGYRFHM